jgi:hypothetical protein
LASVSAALAAIVGLPQGGEAGVNTMEIEQPSDVEWREAVIDLARAQRAYAEITATPDAPDILVNRVWLWLWRAERRRDELLNTRS